MKLRLLTSLFIVTALCVSGCSSKGAGKNGEELGARDGLSEADLNAQREARYGLGSIPMAEGEGPFRDVSFDYDSYVLSDAARNDVEYNVEQLRRDDALKVQLEGHCDERGTAEYNLALGNQRARAIRDALVSYGIDASRVSTISYGEEVPLDPSNTEAAWAKNRRVHFSAYR